MVSGPAALPQGEMPEEVAAKQSGRLITAMPPAPEAWLVAAPFFGSGSGSSSSASSGCDDSAGSGSGGGDGVLFVDVDRRAGAVMGAEEAAKRHPSVQVQAWTGGVAGVV